MSHVIPNELKAIAQSVNRWIDDARSRLDLHEREFAEKLSLPAANPSPASGELSNRLHELSQRLETMKSTANVMDAESQGAEDGLRDLTMSSESLRRKLAEKVGRAAG